MKVFILGAGGHAQSVSDSLGDDTIDAAVVPSVGEIDPRLAPVSLTDSELEQLGPADIELLNGIGQIAPGGARSAVFEHYVSLGFVFRSAIHSTAIVSSRVELGVGVQLLAGAIVGPCAMLGDNVVVNTGAIVEHDCVIESHVHVASGAVVCGGVRIGANTMIGAGATIIQGVAIGADVMVAAGATVTTDIGAGQLVGGTPARPLRPGTISS